MVAVPGGTVRHAVEPACGAYVPAAHVVQDHVAVFATVPGGHGVHAAAPLAEIEPAAHSRQDSAPAGAYAPAAQAAHVCVATFAVVPAPHTMQAPAPALATEPAAHGRQPTAPAVDE